MAIDSEARALIAAVLLGADRIQAEIYEQRKEPHWPEHDFMTYAAALHEADVLLNIAAGRIKLDERA